MKKMVRSKERIRSGLRVNRFSFVYLFLKVVRIFWKR